MFLLVLYLSLFWILFSQLNELFNANKGCCKDNSCGKSMWDRWIWNITLIVSILLTLYVTLQILYMTPAEKYIPFRI